jgi:choice-of-anchor B domain-containing protein
MESRQRIQPVGYVDLDDNQEYAIIGLRNGTGVVEVTDPANPRVVETIIGVNSQWREVKVYQFWNAAANRWDAYAYVTTEGAGGGIQIIDLTQLPTSVSLAGTWTGVSTSHTDQISNIDFTTNVSNNRFHHSVYFGRKHRRVEIRQPCQSHQPDRAWVLDRYVLARYLSPRVHGCARQPVRARA